MIYVVYKFSKEIKEWIEVKRFGKEDCASAYVGLMAKGSDDLYCIRSEIFARGDYARPI